jgi:metal-responsive CopG/Arc/MetJ family transcriptional regulator
MHRTQISLKDDQYANLMQEAQRRGISLSELIRRLADEFLDNQATTESALDRLAGIGQGSGEPVGRDHNRYLYADKQPR